MILLSYEYNIGSRVSNILSRISRVLRFMAYGVIMSLRPFVKKRILLSSTIIRFLLVGVVNTIVGVGTMFLLYNLAHCSYWFSSAANYIVGGIVSYILNKTFTFQNKGYSWQQVIKFALTVAACYLIGYGMAKPMAMWILSNHSVNVQENVAMAIGMSLYVILNYFMQRFLVFYQK